METKIYDKLKWGPKTVKLLEMVRRNEEVTKLIYQVIKNREII